MPAPIQVDAPILVGTRGEASRLTRNLLVALLWLLVIYVVGSYLYQQYEGWSLLDSLYFITITIATVGYGDIVPRTPEGKILTIVLVWVGISLAFFFIYNIAMYRERVLDRHVTRHLGQRLEMLKNWVRPKKE